VPGDDDRVERLTSLYGAILRTGPLRVGAVDVARTEPNGQLIGVAAWEWPGKRSELWTQLRELPNYIRAIGMRHLPATLRLLARLDSYRPRYAHWYLADIAVASSARGLGVGSALLAYRLTRVDDLRLPAYLEATTPGSRRLYKRHGFTPIATPVPGIADATPMLRPSADDGRGDHLAD